jgi:hypothetical protein
MNDWKTLDADELNGLLQDRQAIYERYRNQRLRLDMSRGKPCPEQLELSMGMLDAVGSAHSPKTADGTDTRNYGGLDGIPEAKELFAQMLEVQPDEVIVGGSSSLTMMHDAIARAMLQGVLGSAAPWGSFPRSSFCVRVPATTDISPYASCSESR